MDRRVEGDDTGAERASRLAVGVKYAPCYQRKKDNIAKGATPAPKI